MSDTAKQAQPPRYCPKCGRESGGSSFCSGCGFELAARPAAAAAPVAPTPPPAPEFPQAIAAPRQPLSRTTLIAAATVLVLFVGGGIALAVSGGKAHGSTRTDGGSVSTSLSSSSTTTTTSSETAASEVSEAQVNQVMSDYTSAYEAESPSELLRLFSSRLVRKDRNRPTQDLHSALAEYRHQFAQLQHPEYVLSNTRITTGKGEATVNADYTITSQEGTVHNPIEFHLTLSSGSLRIDRITVPLTH